MYFLLLSFLCHHDTDLSVNFARLVTARGGFHSKQVRWDNCDCHSLFIESFLDKTTLIIEVSVSDCHSRKLKSHLECDKAHESLRG